jgi:hypothetical protein
MKLGFLTGEQFDSRVSEEMTHHSRRSVNTPWEVVIVDGGLLIRLATAGYGSLGTGRA